ncbi:MAG: [acyl-carrier-protein] S-malonyltransferase [Nitrospinae bacterium CG11_big_fil_rev_8_21_14_0_20_56_8]|nr:MAG: [acyl-carrier-protein] S-malonyltransferase [Nitrospinae bacterium CG11_big_fil_rev_8_21_14_0_20_56_8]
MVKIAFVFPGQGAQTVGMGKEFYEALPEAREHFEQASEVLGLDMSSLCFNGPEERLNLTENTQPAILLHSTIALKMLRESGIDSVLAAGHSLGEYSALVAAGSLRFLDAVRLVQLRGRFMQEAVPVGVGAMAAVIGLSPDAVGKLCESVSTPDCLVQPANLNSPEQIVISGHKEAVEKASEQAWELGAKKTVILPVSAPFHCPLMKPAEIKLYKELQQTEFQNLTFPVITNVDAKPISLGSDAREALRRQVCSPVRWTETMQWIVDQGIRTVVELGPGRVLSGLIRRFNKEMECHQVFDCESLNKTVTALKGKG